MCKNNPFYNILLTNVPYLIKNKKMFLKGKDRQLTWLKIDKSDDKPWTNLIIHHDQ